MTWLNHKLKQCDVCNKVNLHEYYDARIRYGQRVTWANVCHHCYDKYGMGVLGTGLGQFYSWSENQSRYVKLRG